MKKLLIIALLLAPAYAFGQTEEDAKKESVTKSVPGDSEHPQGPGTEHHPGQHGEEHDPTKHFNFWGLPFDHFGKDEYGGVFGDGKMGGRPVAAEEPMSPAFIWALVNFVILLLILLKWFKPMARGVAVRRHNEIKKQLDEAKALREQAAAKLVEYETRIKDVDDEVRKLVEGIRADAEADKKRILAAAEAQAAQMKRDAELRIAAEIEMARTQLTREVTLAATAATEKILREKTTPDDQRKLVNNFLESVR